MRYRPGIEREDGWTDWIDASQTVHRIACCDCGLVHDFQFQLVDGRLHFRATRNNRSTANRRRKPQEFVRASHHGA